MCLSEWVSPKKSPSFVSAAPPSVLAAPTPFLCGPFLTAEEGGMFDAQYAGKFPSERAPYSLSFFFYFPPQFFHLLLLPLLPIIIIPTSFRCYFLPLFLLLLLLI